MKPSEYSCYEAISDVDQAMKESLPEGQRYFVLGGIATGALKHPDTYIDTLTRSVYATNESSESTLRDNGTKRDIDVLIDDTIGKEAGRRIKSNLEEATEGKLEISVFGFDAHEPAEKVTQRFKKRILSMMSERTICENGILRYELFPLEQTVERESYEQWRLVTPHTEVGILNPAGHVLAYRMRSITGLRPKDAEKYHQMHRQVFAHPELLEQIMDGKYRTWLDFAHAIDNLRNGEMPQDDPIITEQARGIDQGLYRLKSKTLSLLEGHGLVVNIAQHPIMQKALNKFIRSA